MGVFVATALCAFTAEAFGSGNRRVELQRPPVVASALLVVSQSANALRIEVASFAAPISGSPNSSSVVRNSE